MIGTGLGPNGMQQHHQEVGQRMEQRQVNPLRNNTW